MVFSRIRILSKEIRQRLLTYTTFFPHAAAGGCNEEGHGGGGGGCISQRCEHANKHLPESVDRGSLWRDREGYREAGCTEPALGWRQTFQTTPFAAWQRCLADQFDPSSRCSHRAYPPRQDQDPETWLTKFLSNSSSFYSIFEKCMFAPNPE